MMLKGFTALLLISSTCAKHFLVETEGDNKPNNKEQARSGSWDIELGPGDGNYDIPTYNYNYDIDDWDIPEKNAKKPNRLPEHIIRWWNHDRIKQHLGINK